MNTALTRTPYAVCKRSNPLAITGGAMEPVPWETAVSSGITVNKSGSTIPSLTIVWPGIYGVTFSICGLPNNVTHYMNDVCVNGARQLRGVTTADSASYQDTAYCGGILSLKAGDIVTTEVYVSTNRTATFTNGSWATSSTSLELNWIGGA
ncbi:hypothetical protein [Streptomyces californicus]|uniref:hypothetical protein n=1 Tax=Streptomyces californicus TaxID=67351 RepID=UPI00369BCBB1